MILSLCLILIPQVLAQSGAGAEEAIKKGQGYVLNRKLEEIKNLEKKRKFEFMEHIDPRLVKQLEELKCDAEIKKELSK